MKIGYVGGPRRSAEARAMVEQCGRAVFFDMLGDKHGVDARRLLPVIRLGAEAWNQWRRRNKKIRPYFQHLDFQSEAIEDLGGFNLAGADFVGAKLSEVSFRRANLSDVDAKTASFDHCNFDGANMSDANLFNASLVQCSLKGTNLRNAFLVRTMLRLTSLVEADLTDAEFGETDLVSATFVRVKGLEKTRHPYPSNIDMATLTGSLPRSFLRRAGVPEQVLELRATLGDAPKYRSCFISFSTKNQPFAERLHRDLRRRGVHCWFAPHDLPVGAKTFDEIDGQIAELDKLLVILSENSIASNWVEDEVSKAFAEERRRDKEILLPVRIDDAVMRTGEPWAAKLRDQRSIGNFVGWTSRSRYRRALTKLLDALRAP